MERAERGEASSLPCGAEAEGKVAVMGYLGWPQQWGLSVMSGAHFGDWSLLNVGYL